MAPGGTRLIPCALVSTVLHVVVLASVPERPEIAVTPDGGIGPIAVRLVPSGTTTFEPATQSGAAGESAQPPGARNTQSESGAKGDGTEKATAGESPDTNRKKAKTSATESADQSDGPGRIPNAPEDPGLAARAGTSSNPQTHEEPATTETAQTTESKRVEHVNSNDNAPGTAGTSDRPPNLDKSKVTRNNRKAIRQSSAGERARLTSRARQQVEIHLRYRFRYPRIARQRGWEGRVVLAFRLQPDGRVTDVEVSKSSGRQILDEDARATLLEIGRIPDIADELAGQPLALEVPVAYRLVPANTQRVAGAR